MNNILELLGRWQLDVKQVRDQVYRAPTPRERERWHALRLLAHLGRKRLAHYRAEIYNHLSSSVPRLPAIVDKPCSRVVTIETPMNAVSRKSHGAPGSDSA